MAAKRSRADEIRRIDDPVERLTAAVAARKAVTDELNTELEQLGAIVAEAIAAAGEQGVSLTALARDLGVSRQRLWQLSQLDK